MSEQKNKPVAEVRIGVVVAAIWQNESENGPRFNVTFSKLYRDRDDKWNRTDSFGRDDLLALSKGADLAHTRIVFDLQAQE